MFTNFSAQLYRRCAAREYRLMQEAAAERPLQAQTFWVMGKQENASLCLVHVVDADRFDLAQLWADYPQVIQRAEKLSAHYQNVTLLWVFVSAQAQAADEAALQAWFDRAEPFFGQRVYSVFWRVSLSAGQIQAGAGQPAELFGLGKLVREAMAEAVSGSDFGSVSDSGSGSVSDSGSGFTSGSGSGSIEGLTFSQVEQQVIAESPYKPLHDHAYIPAALVMVNALWLVAMWLNGYTADPVATAVRFGAIAPERIFAGEYYRLVTYMFAHYGVVHFGANALGLWIFGTQVERYFGRVRFGLIYGLTGLVAGACSLLFTQGYAAGASGAVYGLMGAVFAYTFVSKRSIGFFNNYVLLIFIAAGLAAGAWMPRIDNFAHVGGLLCGVLLGFALMKGKTVKGS